MAYQWPARSLSALWGSSLLSGRSPRTPRGPHPEPEGDSELGGGAGLIMLVLAIPVAVVARGTVTVLMPLRRLGGSRA